MFFKEGTEKLSKMLEFLHEKWKVLFSVHGSFAIKHLIRHFEAAADENEKL